MDHTTGGGITRPTVNFARLKARARTNLAEAIARLVHQDKIGTGEALDWLRSVRLTADDGALEDAVTALGRITGLLDGSIDSHDLLEIAPSVATRSLRDYAVERQEEELRHAVNILATPCDPDAMRPGLAAVGDRVMAGAR